MRKAIIVILTLAFITGCGVSKEEHKRIVNELETAREEIARLKGKIEKLKIDVEELSRDLNKKTSLEWEYKIAIISLTDIERLEKLLNEQGKKGWELFDFVILNQRFYFKRPLN